MTKERVEFYSLRSDAIRSVNQWIARGYVRSGYVYNPEYAEQEGKSAKPYIVIIE